MIVLPPNMYNWGPTLGDIAAGFADWTKTSWIKFWIICLIYIIIAGLTTGWVNTHRIECVTYYPSIRDDNHVPAFIAGSTWPIYWPWHFAVSIWDTPDEMKPCFKIEKTMGTGTFPY